MYYFIFKLLSINIGTIPNEFCSLTAITNLNIAGNQLTCYPPCLSSLSATQFQRDVTAVSGCTAEQNIGICAFIAATNIGNIKTEWSCTAAGVVTTNPCNSPRWSGITCVSGSTIISNINLMDMGIIGILIFLFFNLYIY